MQERKIKFRAWDSQIKTMITPELFNNLLNGKEVISLPMLAKEKTFA